MKYKFGSNKKIIVFKFLIPVILIAAFILIYINIDEPVLQTSKNNNQNKVDQNLSLNINDNKSDKSVYTSKDIVSVPNRKLDCAYIAFTFDDGCLSDYELAYPILKQYDIRGTSYIIPKYQDEKNRMR